MDFWALTAYIYFEMSKSVDFSIFIFIKLKILKTKNQLFRLIYILTLILITGIIWVGLYKVQFLEYDENWGLLIETFLISICSFFGLIFIWINWRFFIIENKWITILFLLLSSPISIILVTFNYELIFGTMIKV